MAGKILLESRSLAQIKAKIKKKEIRLTKKTGGPKTKAQLIKAIRKT
jgi:hypothetical protein